MGKDLDEYLEGKEISGGDPGNNNPDPNADPGAGGANNNPGADPNASDPNNDPGNNNPDPNNNLGADPGQSPNPAGDIDLNKLDITHINRVLEGEYTSIDEIKSRLGNHDELVSLRVRDKENSELLETVSDPRSYFADDTIFKYNEVKKQNPEVDPFVINQLLDVENVAEMDGLHALVLKHVMDVPSHKRNINDVRELINDKYGLNIVLDDINDEGDRAKAERTLKLSKLNLEADAERAKKEFSKMLDVKLPEKSDFETVRSNRKIEREGNVTKLRESFDPVVSKMSDSLKNVELKYPNGELAINFEVPEKDKDVLAKGMMEAAINMGLNPADINDVKKLGNYAKNFVIANNLSKILKAQEENIIALMKDGEYKRHHVATPGDPGGGPVGGGAHVETNEEIVRREVKRKN